MPTEEMTEETIVDDIAEDIEPDEDALETEVLDGAGGAEGSADAADSKSDADPEADTEALDELEAEELEMLTDDETSETLVVDEAAEMRAIRREELAMDRSGADEATEDEFVCSRCFLVLNTSQLADARRKICNDCAA
ncbi:MAG: hypothetical protein BMS9Abin07_0199 [Acidimicrobiia bacterium]|nr:MAG: hypothetical protein BMS9Abin07_0199 [Acidimicrobiia bacterium]